MPRTVLVVENDLGLRDRCARSLQEMGIEMVAADSGAAALAQLEEGHIDIVLACMQARECDGIELLRAIKQRFPEVDVVLMASSGSIREAVEAIKLGAYDYISNLGQPYKMDDLKHLFQRLAEKQDLAMENRLLREQVRSSQGFGNLIGTSEPMQKVYRLILKTAGKRHPVLVLGESGTGKELVARAIHDHSPWRDEPFVPIDCGALSPTLIESELFGHVRGAFTGAAQTREGLLASAQAGTVFLDEIGELPVELQVKLLRALQEREIKAVGSNARIRLDARIVAATNRDLEEGIKQGTFRQDLYYRLNVVSIKLPALRERKKDISALANAFLDHYTEEGSPSTISYEAMTHLLNYDWPGNVRELENCIQQALALGTGSVIQVADLPPHIVSEVSASQQDSGANSLEQLERRAILQALEDTGGDRLRAAKLLGIGKTTIYRKLKEYGLDEGPTQPASVRER
jgi:two-component system, NtrC family, response regulator AtoC